jgi:putative acetyltransferase
MDGEKIVGAGAIKKCTDEICELKRMWFLKEYRGKGLGSQMAYQLLAFAKDHGYAKIRLDIYFPQVQDRAITLYKKLGFYEIAPYNDSPAKIFMEKVL